MDGSGFVGVLEGIARRAVPGEYTRKVRRWLLVIVGVGCAATVATHTVPEDVGTGSAQFLVTAHVLLILAPTVCAVPAAIALGTAARLSAGSLSTSRGGRGSGPGLSAADWVNCCLVAVCLVVCVGVLVSAPLALGTGVGGAPTREAVRLVAIDAAMVGITLSPMVLAFRSCVTVSVLQATVLWGSLALVLGDFSGVSLQAAAQALATGLLYVGGISWLLLQAGRLDGAETDENLQGEAAAAEDAQLEARRRVRDFVHDHVLSALVPTATGLEDGPLVRQAARSALEALDGSHLPERMTAEMLLAELESRTRARHPQVHVTRGRLPSGPGDTGEDHANREIPAEAAEAVLDAVAEALRNSIQHARPARHRTVTRTLRLAQDAGAIHVTLTDDGSGFRPSGVPDGRRGIRHSIVERMRHVGGQASVASEPGRGTRVDVRWAPANTSRMPDRPDPADTGAHRAARAPVRRLRLSASMETPMARWILAAQVVASCLHIASVPEYTTPVAPVLALAVMTGTGLLLVRRWPGMSLPRTVAPGIAAGIAGATVICLWATSAPGFPTEVLWPLTFGSGLCCGLLFREHPIAAWSGFALQAAITVSWASLTDRSPGIALYLLTCQLFTLVAWSLTALIAARTARRTATSSRRARELAMRRRTRERTATLMQHAIDSVASRARPVVARIASDPVLTDSLRLDARLLEAELRDELRAPLFTGTRVVAAARSARGRGADVVLLDDSQTDEAPAEDRRRILLAVENALARSGSGSEVVVRVLPPGRRDLASILVDGVAVVLPRTEHVEQRGSDLPDASSVPRDTTAALVDDGRSHHPTAGGAPRPATPARGRGTSGTCT